MPIYEFRCPSCAARFQAFASNPPDLTVIPIPCPDCTEPLRRRYTTFAHKTDLPPHYNPAVGRYITSEADLRSAFSEASDLTSARTGMDSRIVPVDLREAKAELGVTDEGLDATYRRERETGQDQVKHRGPEYGRAGSAATTTRDKDEVRWLPRLP